MASGSNIRRVQHPAPIIQTHVNLSDQKCGFQGRTWLWCPQMARYNTLRLEDICASCKSGFLASCPCSPVDSSRIDDGHGSGIRLMFVDGACSNNGRNDAVAGVGLAFGYRKHLLRVQHDFGGYTVTSQRAELIAVFIALKSGAPGSMINLCHFEPGNKRWVIAADSQYVVKGITLYYPTWKRNGWKNSKGMTPKNLDLWHELDNVLTSLEVEGYKIGFWHIDRNDNVADPLAKLGKQMDGPDETLTPADLGM
ncbi:ribonuclease H-like protein [Meredithblackwellia eburnea MCA 4105]